MRRQLIVVRHARAKDKIEWNKKALPDFNRPLTKLGEARFRRTAAEFKKSGIEFEVILFSPLRRAQQTAVILHEFFRSAKLEECQILRPETSPKLLIDHLESRAEERLAIVGHEPHLGKLASLLLTGQQDSWLELKKGSFLILDFAGKIKAKSAQLRAYLTSRFLLR